MYLYVSRVYGLYLVIHVFVCFQSLRIVLGDLMNGEKPQMLYVFMQFLKSEAAVNVLQFALDCGKFQCFAIMILTFWTDRSVDSDQTAAGGAVWSGSTLFVILSIF